MSSTTILMIYVIVLVVLYFYVTRRYSYWKERNVEYLKPIPIFGNLLDIFLFKCNIGEFFSAIYSNSNEPVVGIFMLDRPSLLIRDPILIKEITVKNYDSFCDRSISNSVDEQRDPGAATGLVCAKYDTWKFVRKAVTPAFSASNLKDMIDNMQKRSKRMVEYILSKIGEDKELNMRDISVPFSMEISSSIFFGIEAKCLTKMESESPVRFLEKKLFDYRVLYRGMQIMMCWIAPTIAKLLHLEFMDKCSSKYLSNILAGNLKEREQKFERRNDYLDLLGDAIKQYSGGDCLLGGSTETFVAGYEAVSSSILFAVYELVKNQEIQQKLREEAIRVSSGELEVTYEHLQQMTYLELFVKELFRMYPIVPFQDRICNQDFSIENPRIVIEAGISVHIPILGIHYDPKYYPEPHIFRPERFMDNKINWSVYLPFGKGPRMCLAKRYSELVIKTCLVNLLTSFELRSSPKTPEKMTFNSKGFTLQPSGDLYLEVHPINGS